METVNPGRTDPENRVVLLERRPLTDTVFELVFSRPEGLGFEPGQHLTLCSADGKLQRDYTPVSAPDDPDLVFCIRRMEDRRFSAVLSKTEPGQRFFLTGPRGHFTFRPSSRPAVFAATGTGIAPFVAMAAVGVKPDWVLHGTKNAREMFYAHVFQKKGIPFVPCLSDEIRPPDGCFSGRVLQWIRTRLLPKEYDFYLCGNGDMIREAIHLIDDGFSGSRIFSEAFF